MPGARRSRPPHGEKVNLIDLAAMRGGSQPAPASDPPASGQRCRLSCPGRELPRPGGGRCHRRPSCRPRLSGQRRDAYRSHRRRLVRAGGRRLPTSARSPSKRRARSLGGQASTRVWWRWPRTTPRERAGATRWLWSVLCLWLGGCSVPQALCFRPDAVRTVDLRATSDANGDRPVAVDLVFARDEPAATALAGLSAREYFARREQLLADSPAMRSGASSWELVPGQHVAGAATAASCGVAATYLFADYAGPGAHRLRADPDRPGRGGARRRRRGVGLVTGHDRTRATSPRRCCGTRACCWRRSTSRRPRIAPSRCSPTGWPRACPYPWGIARLAIDRAALVERPVPRRPARGGAAGRARGAAPAARTIARSSSISRPRGRMCARDRAIVHLAVAARGGAAIGGDGPTRYRSVEGAACVDESTGEGAIEIPRMVPAPILLLGDEFGRPPSRRWASLPLARVAFRDDMFVLDGFCGPRLRVERDTELHAVAAEIAVLLREKAVTLAERLQAPGTELCRRHRLGGGPGPGTRAAASRGPARQRARPPVRRVPRAGRHRGQPHRPRPTGLPAAAAAVRS